MHLRYLILPLLMIPPPVTGGTLPDMQISVRDDLNRTVGLREPARRIVSLAPSVTESLFAIGAGEQIVGVTLYCDFPEKARGIPRVGGMVNPNLEAIIALAPDLIVVSMEGNTREDFGRLIALGIPVFVTNPRTFQGISQSLLKLGMLTGHDAEASRLAASLTSRVDSIRKHDESSPVRVLLFVSLQPLMVAGSGTFVDELLRFAGGLNIAAGISGTYPAYSREAVLTTNPEAIILTSDLLRADEALTAAFPEWSGLQAVRQHRVYRIDPDILSRPGPRAVDGLEQLSRFLHAETP